MNPFPTRQAAEQYLARIPDLAVRDATRARLRLDENHGNSQPVPNVKPVAPASASLPVYAPPAAPNTEHRTPILGALTFTLPFPPSLNSIWRAVVITKVGKPQARILLSEEGRKYRRSVRDIIRALSNPTTPPGARLTVQLTLCGPTQRKFDVDNYAKACLDALTHAGVWADDSLIDELRVTRGPVVTGGQVHVAITPLTATLFEVQP